MIDNFSPEAVRSPTKFIPETQAPGDDDENRKMANTAAFKTPHGITSKDGRGEFLRWTNSDS